MLKALLVDDEPGAIKALKYLLDWESFDFTVSGEAVNGHMALEMLKENSYDLIITDIRMPGISGLDLIAAIREESDTPLVVVSGFEEFDYVRKCLKHSVKDYLLKPVCEEDVGRLLTQIKQEIKSRKLVDKKLYLGVPAMRDQVLKMWARGSMDTDHVLEQLALLNIEFGERHSFCCMIIEMDFQETLDTNRTERDIQTVRFVVRNVVDETLGHRGYVFEESQERFGLLISSGSEGDDQELQIQIAADVQKCVLKFAKIPITIGIGETVHSIKEVVNSFYSANMMLDRKFLLGELSIISGGMSLSNELSKNDVNGIQDAKQQLLDAVKRGEQGSIIQLLRSLMEQFIANDTPKSQIQVIVMDLFASLFRLERDWVSNPEDALQLLPDEYLFIMNAPNIRELFQSAEEKCLQVMQLIQRQKDPQQRNAIEQVKRIVTAEYGNNVSLKSIGEQIYMNPVYLGHLFKSVEGFSFNDYLMQVRMEHAKSQLIYSSKKIYIIASEVGYRQLDWFYKKFKEYTGFSAGEFRSQYTKV